MLHAATVAAVGVTRRVACGGRAEVGGAWGTGAACTRRVAALFLSALGLGAAAVPRFVAVLFPFGGAMGGSAAPVLVHSGMKRARVAADLAAAFPAPPLGFDMVGGGIAPEPAPAAGGGVGRGWRGVEGAVHRRSCTGGRAEGEGRVERSRTWVNFPSGCVFPHEQRDSAAL
jgi:hypothetical protein